MPYYYYIKTGGTATGTGGKYANPLSGTWPSTTSTYYASVRAAYNASAPAEGDYFIVAVGSTETDTGWTMTPGFYSLKMICVETSDITLPATSGMYTYSTLSGANYNSDFGFNYVYGIQFNSYQDTADYGLTLGCVTYLAKVVYDHCYIRSYDTYYGICIASDIVGPGVTGNNTVKTITYKDCTFEIYYRGGLNTRNGFRLNLSGDNNSTSDNAFRPLLRFVNCTFIATPVVGDTYNDALFFCEQADMTNIADNNNLPKLSFENCDFSQVERAIFPLNDPIMKFSPSISFSRCLFSSKWHPGQIHFWNMYFGITASWCDFV